MKPTNIYQRLRKHLDIMSVPMPKTDSGVEIRLLEHLFTPDEAQIALHTSAFAEPANLIWRRYGKRKVSLDDITDQLNNMAAKGSIRSDRKRINGKKVPVYGKLQFAVGMYEYQVNKLTPEFERDSREYFERGFMDGFIETHPAQMRTIPINEKAISEKSVGQYDSVRKIVENSKGPFAVHPCICRQGRNLTGHECEVTELKETCVAIGPTAMGVIGTGSGTRLRKDELLSFFDTAETEGLVLQPSNVTDPDFICCCCKDCCGVLTNLSKLPNPAQAVTSNHSIAIVSQACVGCGACVKRCPMDALYFDEQKHIVANEKRCIGCGLCVSTCPKDVLALKVKEDTDIPPENSDQHIKMLKNRYGKLKSRYYLLKRSLRFKV